MSAVQEIQAAIDKLTEVKAIGWPCDQWTQSAVRHIARNCEIECFNEVEHECEGWARYETGPAISLLARTIDAQLDWLRDQSVRMLAEVNAIGSPEVHYRHALALARAINGTEVTK